MLAKVVRKLESFHLLGCCFSKSRDYIWRVCHLYRQILEANQQVVRCTKENWLLWSVKTWISAGMFATCASDWKTYSFNSFKSFRSLKVASHMISIPTLLAENHPKIQKFYKITAFGQTDQQSYILRFWTSLTLDYFTLISRNLPRSLASKVVVCL